MTEEQGALSGALLRKDRPNLTRMARPRSSHRPPRTTRSRTLRGRAAFWRSISRFASSRLATAFWPTDTMTSPG